MSNFLIKEAQVVYVEGLDRNEDKITNNSYSHVSDEADALRIKVRLMGDKDPDTRENLSMEDLPWCFPLLPKTFQSVPKIGETVFIILAENGNEKSDRFYIGPVISQPQYNYFSPNQNGIGPATSLLQDGNKKHVLEKISKFNETKGAFPNKEDVAIVGRDSEDVILKDGEIDLRCGIRNEAYSDSKDLKGKVIFNSINPTYIQLKFKNNLTTGKDHEASSMINMVADKINLISHNDLGYSDNKELIKNTDLDKLMYKLHVLPYGDVLQDYLLIIKEAILNHGHNFGPAEPPIKGQYIRLLEDIDLDKLCSKDVRIS